MGAFRTKALIGCVGLEARQHLPPEPIRPGHVLLAMPLAVGEERGKGVEGGGPKTRVQQPKIFLWIVRTHRVFQLKRWRHPVDVSNLTNGLRASPVGTADRSHRMLDLPRLETARVTGEGEQAVQQGRSRPRHAHHHERRAQRRSNRAGESALCATHRARVESALQSISLTPNRPMLVSAPSSMAERHNRSRASRTSGVSCKSVHPARRRACARIRSGSSGKPGSPNSVRARPTAPATRRLSGTRIVSNMTLI